MQWLDFQPYVMPYVVGCPLPTLEHHARLVAQEWCKKTLCFTRTLDPVLTDGTPLVEMYPLTETQIVKVKSVALAGKDHTLVDPARGLDFVRSAHPGSFVFTQDNLSLELYPVQVSGVEVVVTAALAPTLRATSLDRDVAAQYAQDMAPGIIASLMRLPKQDFSDLNGSAIHEQMYRGRMSTVAAKIARGQVGAKMRSHTTYL